MDKVQILWTDFRLLANELVEDAYLLENWQELCALLGIQKHDTAVWKRQLAVGDLDYHQLMQAILVAWWSRVESPTIQMLSEGLKKGGFVMTQERILKFGTEISSKRELKPLQDLQTQQETDPSKLMELVVRPLSCSFPEKKLPMSHFIENENSSKWKQISFDINIKADTKRELHSIWIRNSVKQQVIVDVAKTAQANGINVTTIEFRVAEFTENWLLGFKEILNLLSAEEQWPKNVKSVYVKVGKGCVNTMTLSKKRWEAFKSFHRPIIKGERYASKTYQSNGVRLVLSQLVDEKDAFWKWLSVYHAKHDSGFADADSLKVSQLSIKFEKKPYRNKQALASLHTGVALSKVVDRLCNDEFLIIERKRFAEALDTPIGKMVQWENIFKMGTLCFHKYFSNLLENWIQRRGTCAIGELRRVLRESEFVAVSESLESLGADDAIIKLDQSRRNPWKPIYFGVAQPTPYFTGREEEVEQLFRLFINQRSPVVLVTGMGGQGKTELCRQFIKTLKDQTRDNPPSFVWLNGDTANNLSSSITQLALELQIPISNEGRPRGLEELITKISDKLSFNSSTGWLLIIDNVDEMFPEFLQAVHIPIAHSAFVLVTSRRIDILSGEARQMKLDVLKNENAHNLVITFMNQLPTKTEVEDLCRELGNHVLALRQAISYINAQQNENISSYGIKSYINDLARGKTLLKDPVHFLDGYDQTIFLVVTRTMQTIVDNYGEKGNFASEVMEILCLVRPEISIQSLHKIAEAAKVFHSESSAEELHQVLLLLKKFSLISYDDQTSLSIHRLIQKVAKSNNSDCVKTILKNINVENASVEELRQLISIWDHADQDVVKEYSNFPDKVFTKMYDLSMVLELKSFAVKNHQLLHKLLGPDHEDTLRLEGCVGIALYETGNYDEALLKLKEVLEKDKQVFGEDHPETLEILSHIATVLCSLKRYEESLECFETELQSQIRLHGSEHEKTMAARHNKAWVLNRCGRVDEALPLYQEVLEWRSKNLGDSHRSTLITRNNLAVILYKKNQFEEAKTEFEILLSLREKTLGKEHADTINSNYWLAWALWKLGRKDEAMTMMTEVVELRKKVLGTNHPLTQHSREKISQWKASMKQNSSGHKWFLF